MISLDLLASSERSVHATMGQHVLHPETALPTPFKLYILMLSKIRTGESSSASSETPLIQPLHIVAPYLAAVIAMVALCAPSLFCKVRKRKESLMFLMSLLLMLVVYYALVVVCTAVRPHCAQHVAVISAIHVLYTATVRLELHLVDDVVYMQRLVVSACTLVLVCLMYAAWTLLPVSKVDDVELLAVLFITETLGWALKPIYSAFFWVCKSA